MATDTLSHPGRGLDQVTRQILDSEDFPACSQNIQSVLKLSTTPNASISSFSSVLLKDVALSLRVLQAANTALYNRAGRTILSVTHATALLGLNTVVQIAAGLKVLEGFARTKPGMRELATLSLLSASHARQIAAHFGYPRAEEAYLCGLLRNLGEMLVAFYQPPEYARILVSVEEDKLDAAAASRRVLGFDFEDVAAQVLGGWGLDGAVVDCLRASPSSLLREVPSESNTLLLITGVAHALTLAVHRKPEREARAAVRNVLERFGNRLRLTDDDLKPMLDAAVTEARDIFASLGISLNSLKYERQVERGMALLEDRMIYGERLEQTLAQLENTLSQEPDFDLTQFIVAALDSMVESGCYDRALFAHCDAKRKLIQGTLARGGTLQDQVRFFCYPLNSADVPIGQAVLHGEDIHTELTRDSKLADSPLVAVFAPVSFTILPVMAFGAPAGCLYLDRVHAGYALNREERLSIQRLRDAIARALVRKRGTAAKPNG